MTVAGTVLAGSATVTAASPANATPGSTREPVRAHAQASLLGVRALTGVLKGYDALDVNVAVSQANADSNAQPDHKATASATNFTVGSAGQTLLGSAQVDQHALPDNRQATSRSLDLTDTPLSRVVQARLLNGSALARWSDGAGPCAENPISSGETTVADLSLLNGVVSGTPPLATSAAVGMRSVATLPDTVRSTSFVTLRDAPGQSGKAVVAANTTNLSNLTLFAGTSSELSIKVVSRPTLVATSTGSAATSTVTYEAPVLEVSRGGKVLGRINATHPMNVPLIGDLPQKLNLRAVELSIGQFQQHKQGAAVSGSAALLDAKVLPTVGSDAVLDVVVGAQEVSAAAPEGGVTCAGSTNPGGPGGSGSDESGEQPGGSTNQGISGPSPKPAGGQLAMTDASYNPVPYIVIGGALLLLGSVLVAAVPRRLRRAGNNAAEA